MKEVRKLPVTILRGGTSKGVYILQADLPKTRTPGSPFCSGSWAARTASRSTAWAAPSP